MDEFWSTSGGIFDEDHWNFPKIFLKDFLMEYFQKLVEKYVEEILKDSLGGTPEEINEVTY